MFRRQLLAGACCGGSRCRCCTQPGTKSSGGEGRELLRSPGLFRRETQQLIPCPQTLGTGGVKLAREVGCGWMETLGL